MIYGFRNYYDMITWHNSFHILWYPFKFACIPRKCYCLSEEDSKHSRQTSARVFPYPEKILMISLEHSHDFLVLYCLQLSHTIILNDMAVMIALLYLWFITLKSHFKDSERLWKSSPPFQLPGLRATSFADSKQRSSAQTRCGKWKSRLWQDPFPLSHCEDAQSMSCRAAALTQLWQCQRHNSTWGCRCYLKGQVRGQHLLVKPN